MITRQTYEKKWAETHNLIKFITFFYTTGFDLVLQNFVGLGSSTRCSEELAANVRSSILVAILCLGSMLAYIDISFSISISTSIGAVGHLLQVDICDADAFFSASTLRESPSKGIASFVLGTRRFSNKSWFVDLCISSAVFRFACSQPVFVAKLPCC